LVNKKWFREKDRSLANSKAFFSNMLELCNFEKN